MKICITATGTGPDSDLDPRFGRAAHILLMDTETDELRPLDNASGASHGAGIQAAQAVLRAGADAVVTGRIGPKAYEVLETAGISIYISAAGTVVEAARDLSEGRLDRLTTANGPLHGGMRA